MITRKHLQVIAETMATIGADAGQDEERTVQAAFLLIGKLRTAGVVTGNYNEDRFEQAVRDTYRAHRPYDGGGIMFDPCEWCGTADDTVHAADDGDDAVRAGCREKATE